MINNNAQLIYISNIMFFLSMGSSMLSTSQLVLNLSPQTSHRIVSWSISGATIVWTLVAVFSFAFQCGLPNTWDFVNGQCYNQKALYTFIASANLVVELGLILQPTVVIWNLQLALRHKLKIIACFCGRSMYATIFLVSRRYANCLFSVAVGLLGLMISLWMSGSNEETMLFYGVTLSTVLVDNLSIMAASIPYLKPFLQGLEHSMTRIEMAPPQIEEAYALGSKNNVSRNRKSTISTTQIRPMRESEESESEESSSEPKTLHSDQQPILSEIRSADASHFRGVIMHTSEYSVESHPAEIVSVYNSKR